MNYGWISLTDTSKVLLPTKQTRLLWYCQSLFLAFLFVVASAFCVRVARLRLFTVLAALYLLKAGKVRKHKYLC